MVSAFFFNISTKKRKEKNMGLSEEIVSAIRERYIAGATYAELSEQTGVSSSYIRHLLNGKRDPMKLSIDIILRLFPSAQILLNGNSSNTEPGEDKSLFTRELQLLRTQVDFLSFELKTKEELTDVLRARITDLEKIVELERARPPYPRDERPVNPYRAPALSTSSSSNK